MYIYICIVEEEELEEAAMSEVEEESVMSVCRMPKGCACT